jgi:photosystem II stability/assembly factor-like uncharacterized protein
MAKKKSARAVRSKDKAKVMVFVGTRKGAFILTSDSQRKAWQVSGPHFKGWNVMHMTRDARDGRLHAAVVHDVYGPSTHFSDDLGKNWTQAKEAPAFTNPSTSARPIGTVAEARDPEAAKSKPETVANIWNIQPGRADEPGVLYAGIQPAALFKSTDHGNTWTINDGLYNHATRGEWGPGAGGLCLHTIVLDPTDPKRMYVGISAVGCFRTDDGGVTWQPRNKNVRADFLPDKFPEYGQCLHKMVMHPDQPDVLYQQNHCGMYRSDNLGDDWIDVGEGRLPSRFGFPIAVHPHDPKTIYVVPAEGDGRLSIDGKFNVWRSKNGGESWKRLSKGLPDRAHLLSLREAMAVDTLDDAGVYVGTNTGQVFYSRDAGDAWGLLADFLPAVLSVETAVI